MNKSITQWISQSLNEFIIKSIFQGADSPCEGLWGCPDGSGWE